MLWPATLKRVLLAGSTILAGTFAGERPTTSRRLLAFEPLEPRLPLSAAGLVEVGTQPDGGLSDKIVYVHGGHGYTADNLGSGTWSFQRPNLLGMVEDLGNIDQMTMLADYLFRAGATVVPLRPVGRQVNEVVLDNDDPGVTFVGSWTNSTSSIYFGSPGDVPYRYASTSPTETAYARYRPTIAEAGFYPVYAWTRYGSDRATDQLYRVHHSGGISEVTVNHRRVGNGPIYLGTYYFESGNEGYVDISNRSNSAGSFIIADMIRFGNGMGDIDRGAGVSGRAREDESGLYWIKWHVDRSQGVPESEYRATSVDRDAAVSFSPRYAEYMNREQDGQLSDRLFVSFHSNASSGSARGVLGLYNGNNNPATATPNQFLLANTLGLEINDDLVAQAGQFEHNWDNNGTNVTLDRSDIEFGEINNLRINNEFDATIMETGYHDNQLDAEMLRDPRVRDALARATYQGIIKYFRAVDGNATPATDLPAAVTNVRTESNAAGSVTVSWLPPVANSYSGGAATGYRVYASVDGYGFDGGTFVSGGGSTSTTLTGYDPNLPYYFKIVAVNAGGESAGSEVVTALPSGGAKSVLIVNGFDRLDRHLTPKEPAPGGPPVDRVRPREANSRDYVVQVHTAIHDAQPGTHVASTSNEAVISGAVNLADYNSVVWILGEESTADDTFNATEQTKVEQFIAGGGNLFLSGAEIAWDLDQQSNGRAFYENTLLGNYIGDDAGTYTVSAAGGGIFAGLPNLSFDDGTLFYDVNFPDVISPQAGAQLALNYSGGTGGGAAIQAIGTGGRGSVVMFGFPFETITSAALRRDVMERVLDFFATEIPGVEIKSFINGQDADSPPGETLAAGGTATFTYVVNNSGNVALNSVTVTDDNGTPGNLADDFSATLISGDTNSNSLLDVDETWTFSATPILSAGQRTHLGTVSAQDSMSQVVNDADAVNYFGSAPQIHLEKSVEGEDADSPTGPMLAVGSTATFAYFVTNTGNVPLSNVTVVDDNGTPGNPTDDFNVSYSFGDTNVNGMLDTFETWIYFAQRTVEAGQQTYLGTALGQDSIGQLVGNSDPTNFFGVGQSDNADFNGNGVVDAADYVLWRKYNGTSVPAGTLGDADNNGQVNGLDYDIFQAQFGTSPGAGSGAVAQPLASEEKAVAPSLEQEAAVQQAAFGAFATRPAELRPLRRPRLEVPHRAIPLVAQADWDALLNRLAQRKAHHHAVSDSHSFKPRLSQPGDFTPQPVNLRDVTPPTGVLHGSGLRDSVPRSL